MFTIKVALIGCSTATALATAAQAYDLRVGNGGTWVTIPDSSTGDSDISRRLVYRSGIFGDADNARAAGSAVSPSGRHLRTKAPAKR